MGRLSDKPLARHRTFNERAVVLAAGTGAPVARRIGSPYQYGSHYLACSHGRARHRHGLPARSAVACDDDGTRRVSEESVPDDDASSLAEWLVLSWQPIQRVLEEWTVDDLFQTYPLAQYVVSRQWTIWRILSHDIHHGGQMATLLALQGIEAFELRDLGGHVILARDREPGALAGCSLSSRSVRRLRMVQGMKRRNVFREASKSVDVIRTSCSAASGGVWLLHSSAWRAP